jgi:PAS domain S-box-containing protein
MENLRHQTTILENVSDAVISSDMNFVMKSWNRAAEKMYGWTMKEALGKTFREIIHLEYLDNSREDFYDKFQKDSSYKGEFIHYRKDGQPIIVFSSITKILDENGRSIGIVSVNRDITERKAAEKALRESEMKHKSLVINIPGMIYRGYPDWSAEIVSGSEGICGYTPEELNSLKNHWAGLIHPDDNEKVLKEGSRILKKRTNLIQIYRIIDKYQKVKWVEDRKTSVFSGEGEFLGIDGIVFDVTDRIKAVEKIHNSAKEKDLLIKEIYHRVKNNLATLSSLLNLQSLHIEDVQAKIAFQETKDRILSMALVHQQLYRSEDFSNINYKEYAKTMVTNIFDASGNTKNIRLHFDLDDISISIDKAIPCGLVLNELVTNATKHAFPENRTGNIQIIMKSLKGNMCELIVKDDGVGIDKNINIFEMKTMGLVLINLLIGQIDGTLNVASNNGTEFRIAFNTKSNQKIR